MKALNIAISARVMGHSVGGVKEYVTAMITALLALDVPHKLHVYYADRHLVGTFPSCQEEYISAPNRLIWDHWALPRALSRQPPDVVWFPHNVMSAGTRIPAVVSVMDMLYFPTPEHRQREYALADTLYMRALMPPSLRAARQIMTISDWTARDIVNVTGVPRQKIQVIYLAASPEFRPSHANERRHIFEQYSLQKPFFLYVGGFYRRKNIPALLEAFASIKQDIPHDLVLVGGSNSIEIPMEPYIDSFGIRDRVRRLGVVSKHDLVGIYGAADALVFPSHYEGFGLPVVEAFACGCPVISSRTTALGEIAGDAALTFDPNDSHMLSALMKLVASDAQIRQQLSDRGIRHAAQFSYTRAAGKLIELLETAAI